MSSFTISRPVWIEQDRVWKYVDACERLISFVLLVVLSPLLFILGLAIAMLSGRSPLIAHRRVPSAVLLRKPDASFAAPVSMCVRLAH